jgi:outer membrane protein
MFRIRCISPTFISAKILMTRKTIFFFSCALFFISLFCNAQSLTLQQCIEYALVHNISIKQSELNTELSKIGVNQSTANLFPSLNGFASNNYYYGRSIDPYTNTFTTEQVRSNSFSLNSSMSVFEGFQLQNSLKQSKLNYMASKYDMQKIKNDIALNVATFYLQVLYNKELLKVTQDQVDATKIQRDRTKRMVEVGSLSKGNMLDMESQYATDEVRLITAQSQYDQAMLSLKQLLELDTAKDFSIVQPNVDAPEMNAGYSDEHAIYLSALSNQPDIKSYEYRMQSAEKGLSIARGMSYPRLSLSGSLGTNYSTSSQRLLGVVDGTPTPVISGYTSGGDTVYSFIPNTSYTYEKTPFNDQVDNNLAKSIGFSLSIPILNNRSTRNGIKRAKINLEQSSLNLQAAQKSLSKSIQQAVADAKSSYQKLIAGQKSVDALTESVKYNEQKFNLGLISTYDYLLSKNNLAKSQADLLQAKYDYIFRLKVLDFYQGRALTF